MQKATKSLLMLAGGAVMISTMFSACKSKDNSLPPIGGYNSSDDVGAASLIAHWGFENNYNDTKGGMTGTASSGASFSTGIKGQGYQGTGNSYVLVNSVSSAIKSMTSYTVSGWYKIAAQPVNNSTSAYIAGQGAQGILCMYDTSGNWNLLELELEPNTPVALDSVRFHAGFNNTGNTAGAGWQGIVPQAYAVNGISKWVHLVMTYDGSTSTYTVYQNGTAILASSAWGANNPTTILNGPAGGSTTSNMGSINFKYAPAGIVLGAFPQAVTPSLHGMSPQPWSGNLQGGMDELRIYNKALSSTDVSSLYQLESAGR